MYAYIFLLLGTNMLLFPRFFFNFLEVLVITVLIPFLNWYNVNRYTIQVKYVNNEMNYNVEDYSKEKEEDDSEEDDGEEDDGEEDDGEQVDGEEEDGEQENGEEQKQESQENTEEMQNDFKSSLNKVNSCNTVCECLEIEKPTKLCDVKCANYIECECRMNQFSNYPNLPDSPSKVPFYVEYDLD